jgi:GrpB-like predicted nucleotidyltransferase (UPF0157 family)
MSTLSIEDYSPHWPQRFETLRSRIAALLNGMAAAIEHVGSTAVPELAAKSVIDIDVLLTSRRHLPVVITQLASAGYEHQGDLGIPGREAFRMPPNDIPHHLYVCPPNSHEYRRHLAFRDHLRTHPEDAVSYACLKRDLAVRFSGDRRAYTEAKSNFVQGILRRASKSS